MKNNILIIEDDVDIVEILKLYLEQNKFNVYTAFNGKEGLEILNNENINLIIVDIMMPIMDGYELISEVRKKNNKIPIIILSAKSLEKDKVIGFDLGADVYITKPFSPIEVVANVKAIIRRCYEYENTNSNNRKIKIGELEFNEEDYSLKKNGKEISLTSTELKILSKMIKSPGKIFTRKQLCECINIECIETDVNTLMVHISNIRAKIEDNPSNSKYLKTVRGVGYKIESM